MPLHALVALFPSPGSLVSPRWIPQVCHVGRQMLNPLPGQAAPVRCVSEQ